MESVAGIPTLDDFNRFRATGPRPYQPDGWPRPAREWEAIQRRARRQRIETAIGALEQRGRLFKIVR